MRRPSIATALLLIAALYSAGCATAPPTPEAMQEPYIYFPNPPDQPRIQVLKSITMESDYMQILPEKSYLDLLIGKKESVINHKLGKPYGVAISNGVIYVCDTNKNDIIMLDIKNAAYSTLRETKGLEFKKPINITIDADGRKYITDTKLGTVTVLDNTNRQIGTIGLKDNIKPTDIALYGNKVFVTDLNENRVMIYAKDTWELIKALKESTGGPGPFAAPTNLTVDRDGNVYVSETYGYRIQKMDAEGNFLKKIGYGIGDTAGTYARPRGIAVDHNGIIYSVDAMHNVVQMFDQDNNVLMFFGGPGDKPGNTVLPAQVLIDYDNIDVFREYIAPDFDVDYLLIVSSQVGRWRVNVYGFGHRKGASPNADSPQTPQNREADNGA